MDSYTNFERFEGDPNTGVRPVRKTISLYLAADMKDNVKENIIEILDKQIDKYYPDVGGLMMGYSKIKFQKDNDWNYQNDILPINIKAKFYIFQPTIGSELMCIVREVCALKGILICSAHGKFEVLVNIKAEDAKNVVKGELITAKILRVSQRADIPIFVFGDFVKKHDRCMEVVDLFDDSTDDEQSVSLSASNQSSSVLPAVMILIQRKRNNQQRNLLFRLPNLLLQRKKSLLVMTQIS